MPQTLPIHCITGETFPFDWNVKPTQAICESTDVWRVLTPGSSTTSVTLGSSTTLVPTGWSEQTPNAAVLCDINGTPQWCHDGTTFSVGTCPTGFVAEFGSEGLIACHKYTLRSMDDQTSTVNQVTFTSGFSTEFGIATHALGGVLGAVTGFVVPLTLLCVGGYLVVEALVQRYTPKPTRRK